MQVDLNRIDLIRLLQSIDGNCFVSDNQEPMITELEKLKLKNLVEIHDINPNTNGYHLDYEWKLNGTEFINLTDDQLYHYYKKYNELK
jgi:hypothetical protein